MEELENGTEHRLTEKDIRDRIELKPENHPEDIRSLKLPGSYHDKITHLDSSLINFTRLVNLDLSRNALLSLDGLNHLRHLESINLYYNNVGELEHLFKLRSNKKLNTIDLRLNPVTKNEPDYRLFLIRILQNLTKLDDRPVRESERTTANIHFGQNKKWKNYQIIEQTEKNGPALPKKQKYANERADYVQTLTRNGVFDEVEDVRQMLDGLGDAVSESKTKIDRIASAEMYSQSQSSVSTCLESNLSRSHSTQNLAPRSYYSDRKSKESESKAITGILNTRSPKGFSDKDEEQAQTEFRSLAHLTHAPPGEWVSENSWKSRGEKTIPTSAPHRSRHQSNSTVCSAAENDTEKFKPLLDLIDNCYAGQNSLQRSPTFMQKFSQYIAEYSPGDEVRHHLMDREIEIRAAATTEQEKLRRQLETSQNEIKRLKDSSLRDSLRDSTFNSNGSGPSEEVVSMLRESHELIKDQNVRLEREMESLKMKHSREMKQMKENYDRLKSSIQFIQGNI